MRYFNPAPFIAVAAVVAFAAGPAAAHARLVSATPAPDSTVAATRTLTLTFSERSVPASVGGGHDAGTALSDHTSTVGGATISF